MNRTKEFILHSNTNVFSNINRKPSRNLLDQSYIILLTVGTSEQIYCVIRLLLKNDQTLKFHDFA